MKRIIDGKIYDTDTAELIVRGDNGHEIGDGWRRCEEMYRTPSGRYFIYDSVPRILAINEQHKFENEHQGYPTSSVYSWLKDWNIDELPARELKHFGITEA